MVRVLFLFVFVLASWGVSAAPVASLASLEGEVTVLRGGLLIPSEKIGNGFALEAFDTVSTGVAGRADIRFTQAVGVAGTVRLDRETSLYLDLTALRSSQTVGIELLAGAVSVALTATIDASSVEVRTEVGTFASAGPKFRVVVSAAGDVLVLPLVGKVECRVDQRALFVEPGSVVEALTLDRSVQSYPVNVSTLESYEASWVGQRRQIFRDQAALYFRKLASRYLLQSALFQRAWDRTRRDADEAGSATQGAVANLRRAAYPLERSLFRIAALGTLFDEGVLAPSLELNRGYAARDFFRQIVRERDQWGTEVGEARSLYRVQADRHGGEFPKAKDGTEITYDSAFFR